MTISTTDPLQERCGGLDFLGLRARLYIVHHDEPPIELDVVGLTGQLSIFAAQQHTHKQRVYSKYHQFTNSLASNMFIQISELESC